MPVSESEFLIDPGLLLTFSASFHPLGVNGEEDSLMSYFPSLCTSLVLTPPPCANCPFISDCLLSGNSGSPRIDQCHCWPSCVPIKFRDIFKDLTCSMCLHGAPTEVGIIVKVNGISPSSISIRCSISAVLNGRQPITPSCPYIPISRL